MAATRTLARSMPPQRAASATFHAIAGPSRSLCLSTSASPRRSLHTTRTTHTPRRGDPSALYSRYYDKILKSDGKSKPTSSSTNDDEGTRRRAEKTNTMLKRDQELLQKLLDREGGSAGIATVDGTYEEGLGKETKKNMFRLI
ncbi:uncharacterized protein PFL1_06289 [Pseudozyma flocculosa PF-1]|uniref:Uncharacterized protein n=2 Tax=Pseudozyma flocculosa TaxID=84751 RepID=A0A5C3F8D6_9BASI|nr:uncharacterized protein PFL1_06289 [Pseudozyma flocculosa PF-1]EPQ26081.1 hypothetical protein PFL1_06289 [Pseudozyma flocculosa PF-1]SPO40326.1 uncharacterized protein PSFLO_05808 [Pseudozyma flocculosa]